MKRPVSRSTVAFAHDIAMAAVSYLAALYLRLGENLWTYPDHVIWQSGTLFVLVTAVTLRASGLYRGIWRYASLPDLMAIVRAVTIAILVFFPILFLWTRAEAFPRSILFINWFVLIMLLGGPRFIYRFYKDRRIGFQVAGDDRQRVPVLLVGAGDEAELFIRDLARSGDAPYRVVGIVDDKGGRVGRTIHGIDVLGHVDFIDAVLDELAASGDGPQRLVIARAQIDGGIARRLLNVAEKRGLVLSRLPRLTDLQSSDSEDRTAIRPIAIEDLLGRPQAVLDRDGMKALIEGKRVLITGAGGTIGGELARQIAAFGPAELGLLDASEFLLYAIDLEIGERAPQLARQRILADVRDGARVAGCFASFRPEIVFHAAALKHVPMVEENPGEGVMTNVFGTRNVADAACASGVALMVMISTDKAVNPASVMGATKRAAEAWCQALDLDRDGPTRFVTVRFGNVLGSTGSVVPLFQRQLARGGPLTVTHKAVKRYFMTVREAVELVLQASAMSARRHEGGKIYVLDMGEPVLIADLARQLIRLAGLRPDDDIKIVYTGLRAGEKLNEELFHESEELMPTTHPQIRLASPRAAAKEQLVRGLDALDRAVHGDGRTGGSRAAVVAALAALVPEFRADDGLPADRPDTVAPPAPARHR